MNTFVLSYIICIFSLLVLFLLIFFYLNYFIFFTITTVTLFYILKSTCTVSLKGPERHL